MSIVVLGATGKLGGQILESLVRRGVAAADVVAAGRNVERLAALSARGFATVRFDAADARTHAAAVAGATQVMLVSLPGNPRRVEQHRAAIGAAVAAGAQRVVYTSFVQAMSYGDHADHFDTERALQEIGVPHVILRNGVYFTYFQRQVPGWREQGRIVGSAGDGLINGAAPSDLADAAAAVLTGDGHDGRCYRLGVDEPFTLTDLAAELSRQTGEDIPYVDVPVEEFQAMLVEGGMAEGIAVRRAAVDASMRKGEYHIDSGDLSRLIGRAPVSLAAAISQALV